MYVKICDGKAGIIIKTLYLTDLDGTFLNSNGEISPRSAQIINYLAKQGVLFTIASARTYATVVPMFKGISLTVPLVLMNGVCIFDPVKGAPVLVHNLSRKTGEEVAETFKKFGKNPMLYFENNNHLRVEYIKLENEQQENYVSERKNFYNKNFHQVEKFSIYERDDLFYIVTLDNYEEIKDIYAAVSKRDDIDWNFYRDNYTNCFFLEGMAHGISKASGALDVKKILGADKIVAFGDNMNDVPLFEIADEAYAVGNACEELKKISTAVIGTNDEDAVAQFLLERFNKGMINI